jgi:hypothetical protein
MATINRLIYSQHGLGVQSMSKAFDNRIVSLVTALHAVFPDVK